MKVTEVRVYIAKTGLLRPVLVEVVTDAGIVGTGEAGIAYGLGQTAVAAMVKDFSERILLGKDPFAIEAIWSEMYDHSFWAKGGGAIVFAAISALEIALWDIKGKALGVPLYEFLGGKIRTEVEVYANGWGQAQETPAKFAAAAVKAVEEGYRALKCYPLAFRDPDPRATTRHPTRRAISRESFALGIAKVKALRDAIGPDIDILLDLSGGLTTDQTIRFCHAVEACDITFVEEPADPFDIGALEKIAAKIDIPIATGERLYTRYGFRKVLETQAVDIAQPDICNTGGFLETKKIAAMAEAYNMRVAPHVCGSPVGTAAALQLDACLSNFSTQELYPYWQTMPGYIEFTDDAPEARVKNGMLEVPSRPGIGINLIPEKIAPFLVHQVSA